MVYPVTAESDGIKIKAEIMEKEKLYYCIFKEKLMLVYKDPQDVLNCYEVEEPQLVEQVKACTSDADADKIIEAYAKTR